MNGFDFSALTFEPAQFGKYGSLRLRYLKENKPALYQALLQGNFLNAHLNEIDRQAHEMVEQTVQQLKFVLLRIPSFRLSWQVPDFSLLLW